MTDPRARFIAVAPNGARRGKADHPRLPMTAREIADCAAACRDAGAAMLHLHVRDADGRHTLDPDAYRVAMDAVRNRIGDTLVIQITTEAAGLYQPAIQMRAVTATKPEAVSAAMRELCPTPADEAGYRDFLHACADNAVWVQTILYSPDEIRLFAERRARGVIPGRRPAALVVIGAYGGDRPARLSLLEAALEAASGAGDVHWSACAFGPEEHVVLRAAAKAGWHVRVGFENNLQMPDGAIAPDNAALVKAMADALETDGLGLLDAAGLRALIAAAVREDAS